MYLRIVLWAAALLLSPCARADIIVDWNQQANVAMAAEGGGTSGNPIVMARSLAMMHVAMFDAIDACNPAYQHYLRSLAPAPGASP